MSLGFVSSPENQEITILSCCSKKLITLLNISAAYVLYSCHPTKAAAILACSTYNLLITGQKRVFSTPSRKIQREGNLSNSRRVFHWVLVLSSFLGREGQKRFFCIHCSSKLKDFLSRDQTRTSVDMNDRTIAEISTFRKRQQWNLGNVRTSSLFQQSQDTIQRFHLKQRCKVNHFISS